MQILNKKGASSWEGLQQFPYDYKPSQENHLTIDMIMPEK